MPRSWRRWLQCPTCPRQSQRWPWTTRVIEPTSCCRTGPFIPVQFPPTVNSQSPIWAFALSPQSEAALFCRRAADLSASEARARCACLTQTRVPSRTCKARHRCPPDRSSIRRTTHGFSPTDTSSEVRHARTCRRVFMSRILFHTGRQHGNKAAEIRTKTREPVYQSSGDCVDSDPERMSLEIVNRGDWSRTSDLSVPKRSCTLPPKRLYGLRCSWSRSGKRGTANRNKPQSASAFVCRPRILTPRHAPPSRNLPAMCGVLCPMDERRLY